MTEQPESNKPQGKNKPPKLARVLGWLIIGIFVVFLLYPLFVIADGMDAPIIRMFLKPDIISSWELIRDLAEMRNAIMGVIIRQSDQRGTQVDYNNRHLISITDKEEFMYGLLEAVHQSTEIKGLERYLGLDVRGLFDAGAFKILVQNNFCFIRVDLNKLSNHISRNPLRLRNDIAGRAFRRTRHFWGEVESEAFARAFDRLHSRLGHLGASDLFLGNFDMHSPVLFTEDMNAFYMPFFVFNNDPPISISTFP